MDELHYLFSKKELTSGNFYIHPSQKVNKQMQWEMALTHYDTFDSVTGPLGEMECRAYSVWHPKRRKGSREILWRVKTYFTLRIPLN